MTPRQGATAIPPKPSPSREWRLEQLEGDGPDVVVVGGGITGAGIALDLALRGVSVLLVERGDWASATSSASTRLVHGGLRYLERFELGLVRESCLERALLLRNAAGLVWPERFSFPIHRGGDVGLLRLGAGLLLYALVSVPHPLGTPAIVGRGTVQRRIHGVDPTGLRGAGVYLDGATDDARLTLSVVLSAIDAGAICLSRTEAVAIEAGHGRAEVRLHDRLSEEERRVTPRAVVLAGGPGVDRLRELAGLSTGWVAPTRGAHIVVRRERLATDGAVIFPSPVDGRVMFLLAWPRYTVIGTTDLDASPDEEVRATRAEVSYLLDSANALVPTAELGADDVVSTWAGLRPLLAAKEANPSSRSREERIEREGPLYTIAGGKLTAFRRMAEKVAARITADLGVGRGGATSPTRTHRLWGALPGPVARPSWSPLGSGGLPDLGGGALAHAWARRYPRHGEWVGDLCGRGEGGERPLDPETLLGEVDWSVRHEDCLSASDFFLRRTDLGLGPREVAEAAVGPVFDRMGALLGWGEARREAALGELRADLDRSRRWRDDPDPAT